jgi:hypothetical protein
MNDISRISDGSAYNTFTSNDQGADVSAQLAQVRANPTQALQDIVHVGSSLQTGQILGSSGPGATGNSITNANGAPQIDGVSLSFSPEDMAAALVMLQSKTQEAQINTAQKGIETNKKKLEDQNQRQMDKIKDWIKKCEEQSSKEKAGGILGWFKRVFTAIAAVFAVAVSAIATVATGGAAAPFLALAVLALASSAVDIASAIDKEKGGKGFDFVQDLISPSGWIAKGMGEFAKACGASKEQAGIVSSVFAVVTTVAIAAASIAVSGGASLGSNLQQTLATAARVGEVVSGVASGATAVAEGSVTIAAAADARDAENIQADRKAISAVIAKLQKQMEDDGNDLKKVLNELMDNMSIVSQMINQAGQSRSQLSANLAGNKSMA